MRVIFLTARLRTYVVDRLDKRSGIFFGSKSSGGLVKQYDFISGEDHELLLYVIPNQAGRWSAAALDQVLNQIMGPIIREASSSHGEPNRGRNDFERQPSKKRVHEEPDRGLLKVRQREEKDSKSRRNVRSEEVSPSIMEPTQRQKGWVRRRRASRPPPPDESSDGAVGKELFPETDDEETEGFKTGEEDDEPAVIGTKRVPKAEPPEAPKTRQTVDRVVPRGSVRDGMISASPAAPAAVRPRSGSAAAAAAEVPQVPRGPGEKKKSFSHSDGAAVSAAAEPRSGSLRRGGVGAAGAFSAGSQGSVSRRGAEPPEQAKFKPTLNQDEILQLVQKWEDRQGMFDEYVTRPCCIHILLSNQVECLNVITGKLMMPEKKNPVSEVYMVVKTNGAGPSDGPMEPAAASSSTSAAGGADWTMTEAAGPPSAFTEVGRQGVVTGKELERIKKEKEELIRRMHALTIRETTLVAQATSIPELYEELASRRRTESAGLPSAGAPAILGPSAAADPVANLWQTITNTLSPTSQGRVGSPGGECEFRCQWRHGCS